MVKLHVYLMAITIPIGIALTVGLSLQAVVAQSSTAVTFQPPGDGAPRDTIGGGSRNAGSCVAAAHASYPAFTPLLPDTNYGLTVSAHPIFLAYVPPTSARVAFFSLKGESNDYYYQEMVPVAPSGGIVELTLPQDAPALKVGQFYQWSMALVCGAQLRPGDPSVGGWVQRIEASPSLAHRLSTAHGLGRVTLYGNAGLWFDTLEGLLELRRLHPTDLTLVQTWEKFLSDNGLGAIASVPVPPVLSHDED